MQALRKLWKCESGGLQDGFVQRCGNGGGHRLRAENRLPYHWVRQLFCLPKRRVAGWRFQKTGALRREHGGRNEEENGIAAAGAGAGGRAAEHDGLRRLEQLPRKQQQHGNCQREDADRGSVYGAELDCTSGRLRVNQSAGDLWQCDDCCQGHYDQQNLPDRRQHSEKRGDERLDGIRRLLSGAGRRRRLCAAERRIFRRRNMQRTGWAAL